MCGIAGVIIHNASRFRPSAEKMLAALKHRGPDAQNILAFDNALLIHTRLSIVDLAGGAQPMRSAINPNIAVTFNGEIYGYRDIREDFSNYPYETSSDTEVILALYHALGSRFMLQLPGMFALALWDNDRQTLYAARDRFGEKPLYYANFTDDAGNTGLIFASEIKAILATGLIKPKLDRDSLAHYLQHLYVHPRQTIYENIHTLSPAHMLKFNFGDVDTHHYWQLPEPNSEITADNAVEEFRALLDQAVARQLVADVPVGAFLSGGLDSSTITAIAAQHKKQIQTFAFRFDRGVDETPYAADVAAMHNSAHHILEDTSADIAALLVEMANVYDEPFADSSNIPTYLISKLARQHLKVVLTGDGGDELLAGYPWYRENNSAASTKYFTDETLRKFSLPPSNATLACSVADPDAAMRADLENYMPGDILVKIDRAAMAHNLELRAPFLDVELASFLIALPHRLKLDGTTDKLLLRRAFSNLWPPSVATRTKQGFGAPVSEWLARPTVAKLAARLNDPKHALFSLLPFDATRIAVQRRNYQTWILLTLALWLETRC